MEMLKDFDIQVYKLSNRLHTYEYVIGKEFLGHFEGEIAETGKVQITINLDKRENMIEADVVFNGYVDLICDRSLKDFQYPIELDKKVLFKYGEEETELEDNVFVITQNTQVINLSHYIYETIALAIPLKKVHPDEVQADEEADGYYYIDEEFENEDKNKTIDEVDPRWAALKNLKNEN